MDLRCRICRRSDVDELVSLSSVASTQRKQISEMVSATIGAKLEKNDRLPQHICDKCLGQLDLAYTILTCFQASHLLPKCQKGKENQYHRCRICARQGADEFIFLTCICERWKVTIHKMIHFMVNVNVQLDDCLPPYICDTCLKNLEAGYGFKKQYLRSDLAFRNEALYAWEKFEFQPDNPGHLVVELYAELIPNWITRTKGHFSSVYCSVCKLEIDLGQLGKKCEGCLLEFDVSEAILSKIEEHRQADLCEVENVQVSAADDMDTEDLTDMDWEPVEDDNAKIDKVKFYKSSSRISVNIDTHFDVIDGDCNEPFQKVRRKGPTCCGCNQFFLTEEEIVEHREIQHSEGKGIGEHECNHCHARFQQAVTLSAHMVQLQFDTYYWCKVCKVILLTEHLRRRHHLAFHMLEDEKREVLRKFTTDTTTVYSCCVKRCTFQCKTEKQLAQHCKNTHHHNKKIGSTTCKYCGTSFKEEASYLKHTDRRTEQKIFKCKIDGCTYEAMRKHSIIWHCSRKPHSYEAKLKKKKHNQWRFLKVDTLFDVIVDDSNEPFQKIRRKGPICCGCNKFFLTEEDVIAHRKQQHPEVSGQGDHVCKLCRASFTTLYFLAAHENQLKQDTYQWCEACKYLMTNDAAVEKHQIAFHIQDGADKEASGKYSSETMVFYRCCVKNCYFQFDTEEQLLQHFNTTHHHDNTFDSTTCQYCERKFKEEADLLKHTNRRIERNRYRCKIDQCGYEAKAIERIIWHCSQNPHVFPGKPRKRTNFIPDWDHFTVIGKLDNAVDILELNGELCCGCSKFFDTLDDLHEHREENHATIIEQDDHPFRCKDCNQVFGLRHQLSGHTNMSACRRYYFCQPCKTFLWDKAQVNHHKAWRHTNDDDSGDENGQRYETVIDDFFTCCGCDEQFGIEQDLVEHRQEKHPNQDTNKKKICCTLCHKPFTDPIYLAKHIQVYASKIIHKCKVMKCAFQTKKLQKIKRHAAGPRHRDIDGRAIFVQIMDPTEYRCCVRACEQATTSYDSMIAHGIKCHSSRREEYEIQYECKEFKCLVCCKGFDHEIQLVNHKNGRPTLRCPSCNATIKRVEYLAHLEQCKYTRNTTTFMCELCSKELESKALLAKHVCSKKPLKKIDPRTICSICGKSVPMHNYADHIRIHENKRSWACKLCPLRFNTKYLLYIHSRVHETGKRFGCRHGCENRYKAAGDRDRHEKLVHLGIKPFSCQLCSESFVRDRDLRLHGRKHTGRKLFPCSTCDDSFDKMSEFKQHIETCGK